MDDLANGCLWIRAKFDSNLKPISGLQTRNATDMQNKTALFPHTGIPHELVGCSMTSLNELQASNQKT